MKEFMKNVDNELKNLSELYSLRDFSEEQISHLYKEGHTPETAAFNLIYVGVYL